MGEQPDPGRCEGFVVLPVIPPGRRTVGLDPQYRAVCSCGWESSVYLFAGCQPAGAGWAGIAHMRRYRVGAADARAADGQHR